MGILQLYGPDVVVNRTSAEIAFITAVNTQLISYLTLRMVNYTAHPLHTPGAYRPGTTETSYGHCLIVM